ncbi:Alpha/Beta hydrolase protein [Irpex rosettiformis]|uniref:Alpha/Beta hydrolase protein n=1 Tax=Irpex rosettiformis TaxID=378272 RepID=A0ACB8UD04_9APHY|nr:Alpha/Beta hydrolase protein [Irpex rosettiformis]
MSILPVNEDGAVLYYEDSGAPPGSKDYHTVFLIHGFIFHSAIFKRLFRHAPRYNLRFISVNAREYPGSTPLTDEELSRLMSRDPVEEALALSTQGMEFARFVKGIIELERFPRPRETTDEKTGKERRVGGVSILAWSLGNTYLLSLLGHLGSLSDDVNEVLEGYVRNAIVYDPPCPVYGTPPPRDAYIPLDDPTMPLEETAKAFVRWVSTYWEPFSSLDDVSEAAVAAQRDVSTLAPPLCPASVEPAYVHKELRPTSCRMTREELASVIYPEVALRVGHPGHVTLSVYASNANHSFFDTDGKLPKVKAIVLWADMSCAYCPWGAKVLSDQLKEPPREGEVRRQVEIVKLESANHFMHWDEPERFVKFLAEKTR